MELNFTHPPLWKWSSKDNYRLGYLAWESTTPGRLFERGLYSSDEIWVTNNWLAEVVRSWPGVDDKRIVVYEHGIDSSIWTNKLRTQSNKIKFLHIGEPAPRKGGQLALDAFRAAFGDRTDVHLTIKANKQSTVRVDSNKLPELKYGNVSVIKTPLDESDLVALYHGSDVLVYPSFGEGFGLIPAQALSTGMPTICTEAWASYSGYLIPNLRLPSVREKSPWPKMHPGQVFLPDFDALVETYRYCADNIERLARSAHARAGVFQKEYNWQNLTEKAFKKIVQDFGN